MVQVRHRSATDNVFDIPVAEGAFMTLLANPVREGLCAGRAAYPLNSTIECIKDVEGQRGLERLETVPMKNLNTPKVRGCQVIGSPRSAFAYCG